MTHPPAKAKIKYKIEYMEKINNFKPNLKFNYYSKSNEFHEQVNTEYT